MSFESLREGQAVTFQTGQGPKGPRAENVRESQAIVPAPSHSTISSRANSASQRGPTAINVVNVDGEWKIANKAYSSSPTSNSRSGSAVVESAA